MARTRTVKPEFLDDEKLGSISRDARLTFIGMLIHSDDYGVVKGNPLWLKSKIYPYDDLPLKMFAEWLRELEGIRAILPFSVGGEKFYYIRNFLKHQNINRPSQQRNPSPPKDILDFHPTHAALSECSVSAHGALIDETETETETEVSTSLREVVDEPASPSVDPPEWGEPFGDDNVPTSQVLDGGNGNGRSKKPIPSVNDLGRLWNEVAHPAFPRVILPLSERRARKFRPAIRARPDLEWWRALFMRAGGIPFLRGDNDRGWRADLEFVVRRAEEILEGKYGMPAVQEVHCPPRADPECPICHGDGWEHYERNGAKFSRRCNCWQGIRHGD